MNVRSLWLGLLFALIVPIAIDVVWAASPEAASHAEKERALRAQIARMDNDLQALQSQLYALENDHSGSDPSRAAKENDLRTRIERMDREQGLIEDRLSELEKDDPPPVPPPNAQSSTPPATPEPAPR